MVNCKRCGKNIDDIIGKKVIQEYCLECTKIRQEAESRAGYPSFEKYAKALRKRLKPVIHTANCKLKYFAQIGDIKFDRVRLNVDNSVSFYMGRKLVKKVED